MADIMPSIDKVGSPTQMADIPPPVNPVVDKVDSIIQAALYGVAVNAFITYASTQLPFLTYPIFRQTFNYLVNLIAKYIYTYLAQVATFTILDLQTTAEQNAYVQAVVELEKAQALGDADALKNATDSFRSTLIKLVRFDGSSV